MIEQHRTAIIMRTRYRVALIPTLLPQGEGLENPSPCGRGEGVTTAWMQEVEQRMEQLPRAGCQVAIDHFIGRDNRLVTRTRRRSR